MQTDTEANAVTETDRQGSAWLRPEAQIKGTWFRTATTTISHNHTRKYYNLIKFISIIN